MTGPLILITLGVLFLLNNLYPGQFQIGRMWPVVLIVIGLVKILEYFGHSGQEPAGRVRGHSRAETGDVPDSGNDESEARR